ncbi:MAG: HAMP domain-containing histidine kinase, partial [Clostridia bacterium]|nr:HAMP domain-containing histidine kinase [Clostridia bacterium]
MKRLYVKIFLRVLLVLIFSVAVLMGVFFFQIYSYSEEETRGILKRDAERIASSMDLYFEWYGIPVSMLSDSVRTVAENSEAEVMIVNTEGYILFKANKDEFYDFFTTYTYAPDRVNIGTEIVDKVVSEGEYTGTDALAGFYPGTVYTVGVPVRSVGGERIYGVVLLSTRSGFLFNIASDIGVMALISLGVTLLVSLFLTYFTTSRVVKPINEMCRTVTAFSRGNFESRVRIRGQDEIAELGKAFNEMALNIEKTENIRQEFVANITHELKTPMTTITGFVDGILDGTIPPERQEEYLRIVSAETRRLSRMISQTLLASKLTTGEKEIEKKPFDLAEAMRRTFLGFEQLVEAKRLSCQIEIPETAVTVNADRDSVVQVLYNLIDNAVKYAFQGGTLRLTLKKSGDKARVEVYNTGRGIAEKDLPFIFDRFYKADTSRGIDKDSFGLGLYIVKAILNRHGESISVESEEGVYCM